MTDGQPARTSHQVRREGATGAAGQGRVALVIPTLQGGELLNRVLAAWRDQEGLGAELEICCPDSGSTDGTLDVIRRHGAHSFPIPAGQFDHGDTRNRAVAATSGEFVILTVQDALPLSTRVARALVQPLIDDPRLCATFGRQVPRPSCHPLLVERIGNWAGGDELVMQELGNRSWDSLDAWQRLELIRYDHVIACLRRSAWERIPIPTASFGEDVTWARQVILDGGRLAFVPDAVVQHSHDRRASDEARRIYCDHRNLARLVGLRTVPERRLIRANVRAAREHYRALVEARTDVDATTRKNWHTWAHDLALYENWAQYLGGNLARRWWFWPLDLWLRRGI